MASFLIDIEPMVNLDTLSELQNMHENLVSKE